MGRRRIPLNQRPAPVAHRRCPPPCRTSPRERHHIRKARHDICKTRVTQQKTGPADRFEPAVPSGHTPQRQSHLSQSMALATIRARTVPWLFAPKECRESISSSVQNEMARMWGIRGDEDVRMSLKTIVKSKYLCIKHLSRTILFSDSKKPYFGDIMPHLTNHRLRIY